MAPARRRAAWPGRSPFQHAAGRAEGGGQQSAQCSGQEEEPFGGDRPLFRHATRPTRVKG